MRRIIIGAIAATAIGMSISAGMASTETEEPEFGVLTVADGVETTFYTCSGCHSERIIAQQGLTRDGWDELIEWMVDEQGLGQPGDEDMNVILDYLAAYYNEDRANYPSN